MRIILFITFFILFGCSETKVLKLSSNKSNRKLKWSNKWNLKKSLNKVIEWNQLFNKNVKAKKICEKQIKEYFK